MARPKSMATLFKPDVPVKKHNPTAAGAAGFDNSRENIDPFIRTKVIDTKEFYQNGTSFDFTVDLANHPHQDVNTTARPEFNNLEIQSAANPYVRFFQGAADRGSISYNTGLNKMFLSTDDVAGASFQRIIIGGEVDACRVGIGNNHWAPAAELDVLGDVIVSGTITCGGDVLPSATDVKNLGSAAKVWAAVFALTAIFTTLLIGGIQLENIDGTLWINASTHINGSLFVRDDINATQINATEFLGDATLGYLNVTNNIIVNNIGSATNEMNETYVGTDDFTYYGDGQEASITFNGSSLVLQVT